MMREMKQTLFLKGNNKQKRKKQQPLRIINDSMFVLVDMKLCS